MIYKLGILAPIRSGTTYIFHVLRHCNVEVNHGGLGYEGSVLWDFTGRANPIQFEHCWHQTREPLASIASIAASAKLFWRNMAAKNPDISPDDSPLRQAMVYWAWWSAECEKRTQWRYRVEDVYAGSPVFAAICDRLDLGEMIFPDLPRNLNGKPHPDVGWEELSAEDAALAERIQEMAAGYGYDVTENRAGQDAHDGHEELDEAVPGGAAAGSLVEQGRKPVNAQCGDNALNGEQDGD